MTSFAPRSRTRPLLYRARQHFSSAGLSPYERGCTPQPRSAISITCQGNDQPGDQSKGKMAQINWEQVGKFPLYSFCAFGVASWRVVCYTTSRIFSVLSTKHYPTLRTAAGNILCATISTWDSCLLIDSPQSAIRKAATVSTDSFTGYTIPNQEALVTADVVVLYCHGGGYSIGHPLQYRSMYNRWQGKARKKGLSLSVLALQYPLAPEHPYPAQLNAATAAYKYLLTLVPPEKICVAGDSAGGELSSELETEQLTNELANLVAALIFHIRDNVKVAQPGRIVLFSPWIDLTLSHIEHHECLDRDILVSPPFMKQFLVPQFTSEQYKSSDPRISPVLNEDFSGLPAQLVVYGDLEVMQDEARLWIDKCKQAAVDASVYVGKNALHGFGVGGLLCDSGLEGEVDDALLAFLMR